MGNEGGIQIEIERRGDRKRFVWVAKEGSGIGNEAGREDQREGERRGSTNSERQRKGG